MDEATALSQAKKALTQMLVEALFASFDVKGLEEVLAVGRTHGYEREVDAELVPYMNEALAAEIERRKAEAHG